MAVVNPIMPMACSIIELLKSNNKIIILLKEL